MVDDRSHSEGFGIDTPVTLTTLDAVPQLRYFSALGLDDEKDTCS